MLAPKTPSYAPLGSGAGLMPNVQASNMPPPRRTPAMAAPSQSFASPTESEFDDADGPDSVKRWDVDRVCDYLRTVKCGEYEKIFRKNHINGENLLEMDKEVLKEMGIDKVGDRVRLFLGIKKLRTRAYANQKKRNRVCFAARGLPRSQLTGFPRTRLPALTSSTPPRRRARRDRRATCSRVRTDTRDNSTMRLV